MKRRGDLAMSTMLGIRVLDEERHALKEAAAERGITLSDFIRDTMAEVAQRVDAEARAAA